MAHTTTITNQTRDWAGVMTVTATRGGWHKVTVPGGGTVGYINRDKDQAPELLAALVAYRTVTAA